MRFRAGDKVRHLQTGETWILAYQEGDYVAWFGWPEGEAKASECALIKAATDQEHRQALETWASNGSDDRRVRVAQRQLFLLNEGFVGAGI